MKQAWRATGEPREVAEKIINLYTESFPEQS
jgi:hypothetical protein